MANNRFGFHGDKRNNRIRLLTQGVDKIGLGWCFKRGSIHGMHGRPISLFFVSNQRRTHFR